VQLSSVRYRTLLLLDSHDMETTVCSERVGYPIHRK
jgi:hypothetical protein